MGHIKHKDMVEMDDQKIRNKATTSAISIPEDRQGAGGDEQS